MPHGKQSKKNASGAGTIRKKTVRRGGREYTYWEARYTVGFDPGTGRQKQKSVTGRTQKEVAQKLREVTVELDRGTYQEPCKMTLGQWLDIWQKDYLNSVKPRTVDTYRCEIENHIRPELGGIRLEALNTHTIQGFYNRLTTETPKRGQKTGLSPKTVKNVHGVLHKALQQAVAIGYLRFNPADACSLPRVERQELKPLDEASIGQFIAAVRGHPYEAVFLVTLFTGLRQGEVLGLTWECVDFAAGTVLISKQLQKMRTGDRGYYLASTKSGKSRKLTPAPSVMKLLRHQQAIQAEWRLRAGAAWQDSGLVFTNKLGGHLMPHTVYQNYKKVVASIGRPDARFHDLRHSYAVAAIRGGDDIKTVQGNMGHATAAFTLDVYGHVTDQMKQASAARMEKFIQSVSGR